MKVTKRQLGRLIKEELNGLLREGGVHDAVSPIPGRPEPGYGRMTISFDSDVDKGLYIVFNAMKKSRREPEFLQWLSSLGYTQDQMWREGKKIKDILKQQVAAHPDFPGWSNWSSMEGELPVPITAEDPEEAIDEDEEDEGDLGEGEFQIVQAKVAPSKEIAKGHSSGAGSFAGSAQQGRAQASTMNIDPVMEDTRMRLTKRQLMQIIREEADRLSEDRIKRELENLRKNIRDDEAHIDNLEKDIEDERKEAERARREERKKDEGVRVTRNQLRRMIRELDT